MGCTCRMLRDAAHEDFERRWRALGGGDGEGERLAQETSGTPAEAPLKPHPVWYQQQIVALERSRCAAARGMLGCWHGCALRLSAALGAMRRAHGRGRSACRCWNGMMRHIATAAPSHSNQRSGRAVRNLRLHHRLTRRQTGAYAALPRVEWVQVKHGLYPRSPSTSPFPPTVSPPSLPPPLNCTPRAALHRACRCSECRTPHVARRRHPMFPKLQLCRECTILPAYKIITGALATGSLACATLNAPAG